MAEAVQPESPMTLEQVRRKEIDQVNESQCGLYVAFRFCYVLNIQISRYYEVIGRHENLHRMQ